MDTKTFKNRISGNSSKLPPFIPMRNGSSYFLLSVEEVRIVADRGMKGQSVNLEEFSQTLTEVDLLEFFKKGQKVINCTGRESEPSFWEILLSTVDSRMYP